MRINGFLKRESVALLLGALVVLAGCRMIAGYEELEITPAFVTDAGTTDVTTLDSTDGPQDVPNFDRDVGPNVTIMSLTATPSQVVGARDVTLAWVVANADSCDFDEGLGSADPVQGSLAVVPTTTTRYTLTCHGLGGPVSQDVEATVLGVTMVGGDDHTCALISNGTLKCFGSGLSGQMGFGDTQDWGDAPGEDGTSLPPTDLGTGRTVRQVALGGAHTCALLEDDSLKCWGDNRHGQLGLGDSDSRGDNPDEMGDALPAVLLGEVPTALALGRFHSCAILTGGSVKCWGANDRGQLGLGDTQDRGTDPSHMNDGLPLVDLGNGRTALGLAAGSSHTCALLDNNDVKCWGANESGQLGLGHTSDMGDNSNEMGSQLPAAQLGTNTTAAVLGARGDHTCVLLADKRVKCWGLNADGQLGAGDTINHGAVPNSMGDSLVAVSLGTGHEAEALAVGANHTCVLLGNARVKCWGDNDEYGQLGLGDLVNRGSSVADMGNNLDPVDLGLLDVTSIGAGGSHTCAVLSNGRVKCWGRNDSGELGLGDFDYRGVNPGQMGDNLAFVDIAP